MILSTSYMQAIFMNIQVILKI